MINNLSLLVKEPLDVFPMKTNWHNISYLKKNPVNTRQVIRLLLNTHTQKRKRMSPKCKLQNKDLKSNKYKHFNIWEVF